MNDTKPYWSDSEVDRLGKALAKPLRQQEDALPHDVTERLRIARLQAVQLHQTTLARRAATGPQSAQAQQASGAAWWKKLLAAVPIIAAGAGAAFMQGAVSDDGTGELVETDLQILSSEVPPTAFSDPAFLQFLKNRQIDVGQQAAGAR